MTNQCDELPEVLYQELHSSPIGAHGNRVAHDGYVFLCRMCGKKSKDKYGDQAIDKGFDESCMLNCELMLDE